MEIFRKALLNLEPPEKFALQTVQEAIKPQRQTKLVLDENQLLENILRTLLQELVACAVQSGEPTMRYGQSIADGDNVQGQIPRLLDIVLYLCEKEHVEGGMIFQLLEDLTEMSTMKNCKDIFAYIESKQDILGKQELFARGKLVMLRTCNQLLRRLSKQCEPWRINLQNGALIPIGEVPNLESLVDVFGCGVEFLFSSYLGFPLSVLSSAFLFGILLLRNLKRLAAWKPKLLSRGVRLTLMRSTLSSMPIYIMFMFTTLAVVASKLKNTDSVFLWAYDILTKVFIG